MAVSMDGDPRKLRKFCEEQNLSRETECNLPVDLEQANLQLHWTEKVGCMKFSHWLLTPEFAQLRRGSHCLPHQIFDRPWLYLFRRAAQTNSMWG
jgi:hypothetical protein